MPSPLVVPVATISKIEVHPNADTLALAQVLGWQVVVKKDRYREGDKIVYFPVDTVLPQELSDAWEITPYLSKQRIRATRLRGEPSFGLVMPLALPEWEVGDNVAEQFPGVHKYEPPVRDRGGHVIANPDAQPKDPMFPEYTSINNLRHYPNLLDGEPVIVTEKLHGTNSRIGMVNGEWMAGSHRVRRGEGDALYWSPKKHVEQLVEALGKKHRQVIVFGEILGPDVQNLSYGFKGHDGYYAFDILLDGRYLDFFSFYEMCVRYSVPMAPSFFYGTYDFEQIKKLAKGTTLLNASHMSEGIIVRPWVERHDPKVGRTILKYVSDDFLLAKYQGTLSDYAEV